MEDHIKLEIESLCTEIHSASNNNSQGKSRRESEPEVINFKKIMRRSATQNIAALMLGRPFPPNDPFWKLDEDASNQTPSVVGLLAFFPTLAKIFSYLGLFGFKRFREI